jgi:hypothetical protein
MALAPDEGFTSLALGMQRVELLFQPLLGGFAGVDRTAQSVPALRLGVAGFAHRPASAMARGRFLRPKKTGPDQCTPVISVATLVSER